MLRAIGRQVARGHCSMNLSGMQRPARVAGYCSSSPVSSRMSQRATLITAVARAHMLLEASMPVVNISKPDLQC